MLPWPSRAERQAAIDQAREHKERSLRDLEHARAVQRDIEHQAYTRNGYSDLIARQIIEGWHGSGGHA